MSQVVDAYIQQGMDAAINELTGHVESARKRRVPKPQDDEELWFLTKELFGIEIPTNPGVGCTDHCAPFDAYADAYFARVPIVVWLASRGFGGKSFMLAVLSCMEAATLGAKVNLLGGSGEQAQRVLKYMYGEEVGGVFWDHEDAPTHLIRGGLEKGALSKEMSLINRGYIRALMASQRSVRGPHPERLRLDEIDEMDLTIFDAAMGQPMNTRDVCETNTVASSTWHNADGTMTTILERAKNRNWPVYTWCYRANLKSNGGWLPDVEIENKKATVTVAMWDNEYELQTPNPATRAIDPDIIPLVFKSELGNFKGRIGQDIVIENFDPNGHYYHGSDWAKRQDFTVIMTFRTDVVPVRLVHFIRIHRKSWPVMIKLLEERIRIWTPKDVRNTHSAHDATGIGDVVSDLVGEEITNPEAEGHNPFANIESEGVWLQGKIRSNILSSYITAIEHQQIEFPNIEWLRSEHELASVDDVYSSAKKHHLPDSIAAGALGWYARNSPNRKKRLRLTWGK